jgi:response regulator of citrate/malate metabolism
MRCVIIADDEFSGAVLQRYVLQTGELDLVTVCASAEDAVEVLQTREAELVLLLHPVREAQFFAALEQISDLPDVHGEPAVIRVEGDA